MCWYGRLGYTRTCGMLSNKAYGTTACMSDQGSNDHKASQAKTRARVEYAEHGSDIRHESGTEIERPRRYQHAIVVEG